MEVPSLTWVFPLLWTIYTSTLPHGVTWLYQRATITQIIAIKVKKYHCEKFTNVLSTRQDEAEVAKVNHPVDPPSLPLSSPLLSCPPLPRRAPLGTRIRDSCASDDSIVARNQCKMWRWVVEWRETSRVSTSTRQVPRVSGLWWRLCGGEGQRQAAAVILATASAWSCTREGGDSGGRGGRQDKGGTPGDGWRSAAPALRGSPTLQRTRGEYSWVAVLPVAVVKVCELREGRKCSTLMTKDLCGGGWGGCQDYCVSEWCVAQVN